MSIGWAIRGRGSPLGTLRAKLLAAFVLVALFPLSVLVALNNRSTRAALTEASYRSLSAAAGQTAASLDTFMRDTLSSIGADAQLPSLRDLLLARGAGPPRCEDCTRRAREALASRLSKDPIFIRSYALLDLDGRLLLDTRGTPHAASEADSNCFRGALETNLPYVSRIEFPDGEPVAELCFSSPLHTAEGKPVGVLRMRYSAAILRQMLIRAGVPGDLESFALLVDDNGLVLVHGGMPPTGALQERYPLVAPLPEERQRALQARYWLPRGEEPHLLPMEGLAEGLEQAAAGKPYFHVRLHDTGAWMAAAVTSTELLPWRVVFLQSEKFFIAPVASQTRHTLALSAVVLVAVAALAIALAQRLARPITHLTGIMERVASGELGAQATLSAGGELGALVESFNAMSAGLKAREDALSRAHSELEHRVKQRTRELRVANARLIEEMAERERIQHEREALARELVEAAHLAGMAEIATNILHNAGNVLTSVNTSAHLLEERLRGSVALRLRRLADLLREHEKELATFLTQDAVGRQLLPYLQALVTAIEQEQREMLQELQDQQKNIEHIRGIMTLQQAYARVGSRVPTEVSAQELMEDAVRINQPEIRKFSVRVVREFEALRPVYLEKHKVLQILVNLVKNAVVAMSSVKGRERQLTVRVQLQGAERICFQVSDTGVGIAPENLVKIFQRGYTTRAHGHGFGLHSGALAAKEMGGTLTVASEGLERGATFTLVLPIQAPPTSPEEKAGA